MTSDRHLTEDQFGAMLESRLTRADETWAWLHIADCADCAAVFNELAELRGSRIQRFGQYQLLSLLGRGGMGEVYLARSPALRRPVVLKRILGTLLDNPDMLAGFLDETRIAARLRHPNIVRIDELGEVDGEWFVRMEYVEGASLNDVIKKAMAVALPISLEVVLSIGLSMANALEYAHHAVDVDGRPLGLVHRDVTPHNMLLSRKGVVKLIDFGVARAEQRLLRTSPGMIKGKLAYMSLEQAEGKPIDGRCDIFALGVCLWELLTGRRLFRADTEAQTLQRVFACRVSPPSLYRSDIPPEVDALVLKAVSRSAENRFARAGLMAEAIETVIERYGLHGGAKAAAALVKQLFPEAGKVEGLAPDEEPTAQLSSASSSSEGTRAERPKARAREQADAFERAAREAAYATAEAEEPLSTEQRMPGSLPDDEHALIGRAAELADLHQLLGAGDRLVTLIGPGGVGKSRLAREVARQQASRLHGHVWLADLSSARTLESACLAIADALGVALPASGAPGDAVGALLAARRDGLLVVDNAEVLVGELGRALTDWLRVSKGTAFLVCSQVALGVSDEKTYELMPLPVESHGEVDSDAMLLFLERARAQNPRFKSGRRAKALIQQLVRKLEGIPLAIELAASQMGLESIAAAKRELSDHGEASTSTTMPLTAVTAGASSVTSSPFQAMDSAFETTWARLTDEERAALAQCTAFVSGFTIDAAVAVVQWPRSTDTPHAERVLTVLARLRAKSLLRVTFAQGEQPRYGMYESIRGRVAGRLAADEVAARGRHAQFFLDLGELLGPAAERGASVLDALGVERENLMRAFDWWLSEPQGGVHKALRVLLALDAVFMVRGPYGAHLSMLDAVLRQLETPAQRALALEARARILLARGRLEEAASDLQAVLAEPLDARAEGRALAYLGSVRKQAGELPTAKALYERSLELLRAANDTRMCGRVLANMSVLAEEQGDPEAESLSRQALELHRQAGDRRFEGVTLTNLAVIQQIRGDWAAAEDSCSKAIAVHREVGNRRSEGIVVTNLADLERDRGANDLAIVLYRRALVIHREVGNRRFEAFCMLNHALLMLEARDFDAGRARLDEALGLFRLVGDKRHSALALGARGALRALHRDDQAIEDFKAARHLLTNSDPGFLAAVDVYQAQVQFAEAERLEALGQADDAVAWRESAAARIDAAVRSDGGRSLAERFEHVRLALRVLRAWLGPATARA